MVFLETLGGLIFFGAVAWLVFVAWGEFIIEHKGTFATILVLCAIAIFAVSLAFNGLSLTGANLHPAPPPSPTGSPT